MLSKLKNYFIIAFLASLSSFALAFFVVSLIYPTLPDVKHLEADPLTVAEESAPLRGLPLDLGQQVLLPVLPAPANHRRVAIRIGLRRIQEEGVFWIQLIPMGL